MARATSGRTNRNFQRLLRREGRLHIIAMRPFNVLWLKLLATEKRSPATAFLTSRYWYSRASAPLSNTFSSASYSCRERRSCRRSQMAGLNHWRAVMRSTSSRSRLCPRATWAFSWVRMAGLARSSRERKIHFIQLKGVVTESWIQRTEPSACGLCSEALPSLRIWSMDRRILASVAAPPAMYRQTRSHCHQVSPVPAEAASAGTGSIGRTSTVLSMVTTHSGSTCAATAVARSTARFSRWKVSRCSSRRQHSQKAARANAAFPS